MPSLGEAPSGGARALGYLALFQVTRRKGGTNSRHDRRNGYSHQPTNQPTNPPKKNHATGGGFASSIPAAPNRLRISNSSSLLIAPTLRGLLT